MNDAIFSQLDFGPLKEFLDIDDITDVSYSNGGQVWLKSLSKGVYQVDRPEVNNTLMEKLAFQCANVMGKTFNMAHPFLDAESAELRLNFVHDSIATNGIACVIRKTPAKIRLNRDKLLNEQYVRADLHDFLIKCVEGHCNIIVSGETGSGKTELVKYLASHTKENEKVITIEDTLELHLDKIFPHRDIVAMKTNNIASYSDVLVTCMRQNPKWILLSEVRSAEAVMAVRNSISSGHNILSTIHADKASSIPMRMYSLLETNQEIEQFLATIHRYVQIGIYVKGYFSKVLNRFQREIIEVCEFYVDDDNMPQTNTIFRKSLDGSFTLHNPTSHLLEYMGIQGVMLPDDVFGIGVEGLHEDAPAVNDEDMETIAEVGKELDKKTSTVQPSTPVNPNNQTVNVSPTATPTNVTPINNTASVATPNVAQSVVPNTTPTNNTTQNVVPNATAVNNMAQTTIPTNMTPNQTINVPNLSDIEVS